MKFETKLLLYFAGLIIVGLIISGVLTNIFPELSVSAYEPQIQIIDIDAEVIKANQKQWTDSVKHNVVELTVFSQEHGVSDVIVSHERGNTLPQYWDAQTGDIVDVKLMCWVNPKTNEIIRKEIRYFT